MEKCVILKQKSNKMKPQKSHFLSILFLAIFLMCGFNSFAQKSRESLEADKKRIEKEIKALNTELNKTKKDKNLSAKQLSLLKKKIEEREKLIKNINSQVGLLNKQIDSTQKNIDVLQKQIDQLKREYAKVICTLYRQQGLNSQWTLIFSSKNFNDAFQKLQLFEAYSKYRKEQVRQIQSKETVLDSVNKQLESKKITQVVLLSQEEQQKQKLAREQQQKQKSLAQIQTEEKNLSQKLSKKRAEAQKLQKQIQQMIAAEVRKRQEEARRLAAAKKAKEEAEAKARKEQGVSNATASKPATVKPKENYTMAATPEEIALSNDFIQNKGRLPWPTEKAAILSPYGEYVHPESKGKNFNNGITLLTGHGSSVRSIFDGTVASIGTGPNGQKVVIISHGEFMTVYTNLETVSVKKGSKVKTKQVIGIVHDTEGEKQSEVNFQIWKATKSQNPAVWLAPL